MLEKKIISINKEIPKELSILPLNASEEDIKIKLKELKEFKELNKTKEDFKKSLKNMHIACEELKAKMYKLKNDIILKSEILGKLGIDKESFLEIRKTKLISNDIIENVKKRLSVGFLFKNKEK